MSEDIQFDAVVAKNNIARTLRALARGEYTSINELPLNQLRFDLNEIETYIGVMNQPSVDDILESFMEI